MTARFPWARFASLLLAIVAGSAPASGDCLQPPDHVSRVAKHGHERWRDDRLIVFGHAGEAWAVPSGWAPVGAGRTACSCVRFPPSQAAVMVRADRFQFVPIAIPHLGMRVWRVAPVDSDSASLAIVDTMIGSTFERVAQLYPLGLPRRKRGDHFVLLTVNLAGDGYRPETRLFPNPGPHLSVIFYNLDDPRGGELFIHTTTHLFNRHRARRQAEPEESALPRTEYQELVAGWAELAFVDDARRSERFDFLLQNYRAVVDGDASTIPTNLLLAPLTGWKGPIGLGPMKPASFEVSEFQHYVLAPLLMLALDGLLERSGTKPSLLELLREIHAGKHRGLFDGLAKHLPPAEMATARGWFSGVPVPEDLARAGLDRLP